MGIHSGETTTVLEDFKSWRVKKKRRIDVF